MSGIVQPLFSALLGLLHRALVIDGQHDPASFYLELCRLAAELTQAEMATLYLAESSGEALISVADFRRSGVALPGRRLKRGEGVAGAALQCGELQAHSAARPHPRFKEVSSDHAIHDMIACPFAGPAGGVSGVLEVMNAMSEESWSAPSLAALRELAQHTATALGMVSTINHLYESNRQLRTALDRTAMLYALEVKIADRRPLAEMFDEILLALERLFGYEHLALVLRAGDDWEIKATRGMPPRLATGRRFAAAAAAEDELAAAVAETVLHRRIVRVGAALTADTAVIAGWQDLPAFATVPLDCGGRLLGVLIFARGPEEWQEISEDELSASRVFLTQVALTLDQALELEHREVAYSAAVRAMADAVEDTGHAARLVRYAVFLADQQGLDVEEKRRLEMACLLHDLGKTAVPEPLRRKPAALTEEEYRQMKNHSLAGAEMLDRVEGLKDLAPLVRGHHERWDGRGYPDGLKGEAIPLSARIIALVDAFDAMTHDQPYSPARTVSETMAEIDHLAGSQFDPHLVKLLHQYPFFSGEEVKGSGP